MQLIQITLVRFDDERARHLLDNYVFGGWYSPSRAPRGISPELVALFLQEELQPDSPPEAYGRAVELLQFYERADLLPHLRAGLKRQPESGADLLRAAHILQSIGDLGTPQETAPSAAYLDAALVPSPLMTPEMYPVILETLIALAPAGSTAQLARRLAGEVAKAAPEQKAGVQQMFRHDKLRAVQRNDLPRADRAIALKTRLAAQPAEARRAELVGLYLGTVPAGGLQLAVWAARMLRYEAMYSDSEPVWRQFRQALDSLDAGALGEAQFNDIALRAGQAILYLHGELSPRQLAVFGMAQNGSRNFLWDDPTPSG